MDSYKGGKSGGSAFFVMICVRGKENIYFDIYSSLYTLSFCADTYRSKALKVTTFRIFYPTSPSFAEFWILQRNLQHRYSYLCIRFNSNPIRFLPTCILRLTLSQARFVQKKVTVYQFSSGKTVSSSRTIEFCSTFCYTKISSLKL